MSKLPLPIIETDRLVLRAFTPADAEDVFRACSNPALGHDAGWQPHTTLDDSLFYINEVVPLGYIWAITEKPDPRVIGSIGFLPDPRTPDDEQTMMLGYWMAQERWNCGFTTEAAKAVLDWAFAQANLFRITVSHFPFNEASRRVIQKCGFEPRETALWVDEDAPDDAESHLVQWYELLNPQKDKPAVADLKPSSSFFQNKACEYFPCHEGVPEELFNCILCYCPLYALGPNCGGNFSYTEKGAKDCSGCTVPHRGTDGVERVKAMYPQIADLASQ